jgi:hypothetical protein
MNVIFFAIALIAFITTGWHQVSWVPMNGQVSPMAALSKAMIQSAADLFVL